MRVSKEEIEPEDLNRARNYLPCIDAKTSQRVLFLAYSAKKKKHGTYQDIGHRIDQKTRSWIESRILEEYHKAVASKGIRYRDEIPGGTLDNSYISNHKTIVKSHGNKTLQLVLLGWRAQNPSHLFKVCNC